MNKPEFFIGLTDYDFLLFALYMPNGYSLEINTARARIVRTKMWVKSKRMTDNTTDSYYYEYKRMYK